MAKILIVDDDPGMRQVIAKVVCPQGHTLVEAEDGHQAIDICQKEKPDIALFDIDLPDMGGYDILKGLKKINPQLPVIILSGFSDIETAVELVRQGGFDYISKPFKIDDFIAMIQKALSKAAAQGVSTHKETAAGKDEVARPAAVDDPQKKKKNSLLVYAASAVVIVIAAGVFLFKNIDSALPEAEFSVPYSNPAALCWDGRYIWAADWVSGAIYQHLPDKMTAVNVFKSSDTSPVGLAVEPGSIWTCNSFDQKIYKHALGASLSLSGTYKSPGPSPAGLYYDGINLWSVDFQQNKIYKHKLDKALTVEGSYISPAANTRGIFENKGHFYIADAKTNRIFKVKKETFSVAGIYTLARFEGAKDHFSGISWDGKSMWVCAEGVQKIFRFPLKSLKPVKF